MNIMSSEIGESISIFKEATNHILQNLNDTNVPLLSSISKVTDPENPSKEYDFDSVHNVLCLIHKYFADAESNYSRQYIYETFGRRLVVENVDQLTENFNRIMKNVRRFFPDFNLAQESHNHIFGSEAIASCYVRRCSEEEAETYARQFTKLMDYSEEEIMEMKDGIIEKYETGYSDDIASKARNIMKIKIFSSFSDGLRYMFNYDVYTGREYAALNTILRSIKTSDMTLEDMVRSFNSFAQNLALPFYSGDDFAVYRGDTIPVSSDMFTTKGFYSGGLSVSDIGYFAKNGGRIIKINIVKGTPFLPIVLQRKDEGEVVLLPGTVLKKETEMKLQNGHYAEYTVVENPPKLSDIEEATLFKHAIPSKFREAVRDVKMFSKLGKKWSKGLEPPKGVASFEDTIPFVVNLINSRYGGDW